MFQKRIDAIREQLANLEKEMEIIQIATITEKVAEENSKPARHGKPWSEFEKSLLKEELSTLADKLARQFGRTSISILLHIHTYISGGMKDV